MKFSSKSPTRNTKNVSYQSPNKIKQKTTTNYIEKTLFAKEAEYWRSKFLELEQFCQGKQSYENLENELQIWKSKYQQLSLRVKVVQGSEQIIQEYQSRIQELNNQSLTYNSIIQSPQKNQETRKVQELLNKIDKQQETINQLQMQIEEQKQSKQQTKREFITTANESDYQSFNQYSQFQTQYNQQNNRVDLEQQKLENENINLNNQINVLQKNFDDQQKLIDQQKEKIEQLEQQLVQIKLYQLKLKDQDLNCKKDQDLLKLQNEIQTLHQKLREVEKQKRQELIQKDDHYNQIISQLKSQIHNQIQSGEMRLSTLQNILKDKQINMSYDSKYVNEISLQNPQDFNDNVYVRLGSDIKTIKGIIAEDNYRDKFYK